MGVSQRPRAGEMTGRSRAWGPLPPGSGRGDAARQAGPARLPQGSKGWPLWAEPPDPQSGRPQEPCPSSEQAGLFLTAPCQSTKCYLGLPPSSLFHQSPAPLAPTGSLPGRGQWVHQLQRTPPRPPAAPPARQVDFSRHAGWGLGPGAPVAVGLEQPVSTLPGWSARPGTRLRGLWAAAGAPWEQGGWAGTGWGARVPAQGRTRRVPTPSPQSGCRVASSGFSQSPSQSGRSGLCPSSPAPCQRVSQPRAG